MQCLIKLKARRFLFCFASSPQTLPRLLGHRAGGPPGLLVFTRNSAEMGVPLSKYRVIQSCLDIQYVRNNRRSHNGKVEDCVVPAVPSADGVARPATARQVNCGGSNRGSIISRMSTESVAVDADSHQSPEHTHTVNCWTPAGPEGPIHSSPCGSSEIPRRQQKSKQVEEECAVCSSAPIAIYVSDESGSPAEEDSLVVQVHAVDEEEEDQFDRRPYPCPDRALFQLPAPAIRLESTDDGYCGLGPLLLFLRLSHAGDSRVAANNNLHRLCGHFPRFSSFTLRRSFRRRPKPRSGPSFDSQR